MLHCLAIIFALLLAPSAYAADDGAPPGMGLILSKDPQPGEWRIQCSRDSKNLKSCTAVKQVICPKCEQPERVKVIMGKIGVGFSFGPDEYPGTSGTVRIGDNDPIAYEGSPIHGAMAKEILRQMLSSKRGTARYKAWPKRKGEYQFLLEDFRKAHDDLVQAYNKR